MIKLNCESLSIVRTLDKCLKVIPRSFNIHRNSFLLYIRVTYNNHNISWCCESFNICWELLVFYYHWFKFVICFNAWEFELFDDVWDFFESVFVFVLFRIVVRNHKECGAFEKNYFISIKRLTKCFQVLLKRLNIGQQKRYNLWPCFVKRLIPNTCLKTFNNKSFINFF